MRSARSAWGKFDRGAGTRRRAERRGVGAISSRIDTLSAGGDVIGAQAFVFVLLPVTDILGFTKDYSLTRPISKPAPERSVLHLLPRLRTRRLEFQQ